MPNNANGDSLHEDLARRTVIGGFDQELRSLYLAEQLKRHVVAIALAVIVVLIITGSADPSYGRRTFISRLFSDWTVISFIGLEALLYYALSLLVGVIRRS